MKLCNAQVCCAVRPAITGRCWNVQEHFRSQKPEKTAAQLARQQAALLASVPEDQRGKLSADMLNAATGLGMVNAAAPFWPSTCCGVFFVALVALGQGQWLGTRAGCAAQGCCLLLTHVSSMGSPHAG